ncbi:uncharacterized protein LOC119082112 isoform X1 [Bradysia coprophila]|uniref:uncharacterized protein LOC119082112 isoform X1 n=1 Tax=Bradysia coprophila TaxID=38358 RepID=UPI00187DB076|nr:uncharacterized protein LOC119082112 isoform X1 [Bradysia coprophila]
MKWRTTILIIAVFLVIKCHGIALDCVFRSYSFALIGSRYVCVARVLFDANENVTTVYGLHETGKGHEDVHGIVMTSQNLEFVPTNIESFFPNVIAISLWDNHITSIQNRHLAPFPNFEYLWLEGNNLTSVDGGLFSGLNSMRFINFNSNRIRHVGHDLDLPLGGEVRFTGNSCISQTAATPDAVATLKLNLLRNCPPTISQIEDSLETRPNLLTYTYGQVQGLRNEQENMLGRIAFLESIIGNKLKTNPKAQFLIDMLRRNN